MKFWGKFKKTPKYVLQLWVLGFQKFESFLKKLKISTLASTLDETWWTFKNHCDPMKHSIFDYILKIVQKSTKIPVPLKFLSIEYTNVFYSNTNTVSNNLLIFETHALTNYQIIRTILQFFKILRKALQISDFRLLKISIFSTKTKIFRLTTGTWQNLIHFFNYVPDIQLNCEKCTIIDKHFCTTEKKIKVASLPLKYQNFSRLSA